MRKRTWVDAFDQVPLDGITVRSLRPLAQGAQAPKQPAEHGDRSLPDFARYFLRLGAIGFGGPIALVAAMQRDLVERRKWITPAEYREGLALAQLAPGPLAAQLCIYFGWLRHGIPGATVTGLAFVGPSLVMVLALAWLYLRFGGLAWIQAAFYGIGAAVIAIVARSASKLVQRTLGRDAVLIAVGVVNAAVVVATERELVGVFLVSAMVVPLLRRSARTPVLGVAVTPWLSDPWWVSGLHGPAGSDLLGQVFALFAKAAIVVFGSGLAVLPFLHGEVVTSLGWLTERQFLDAVAVAMITPGPVVITVGFIGYLVAGPLGGLLAALGMFLPTYLVVVLMAPWFRRVMDNPTFRSAVDGVTAAATGALAGAVIVLGRRALVDVPTWGIAIATLVLLWKARRIPEPVLILGAAVAGLLVPR